MIDANDKKTIDVFPAKRGRGRPRTATVEKRQSDNAERQRRFRAKQKLKNLAMENTFIIWRTIMTIKENTFAEACYNDNTIQELQDALQGDADFADMKTWDISEEQWFKEIKLALAQKLLDLES